MRRIFLTFVVLGKASGVGLWLAGGSVGAALALFFVPGLLLLGSLVIPSAPGLVTVRTRFSTSAKEVWLTIDDGPDPVDTPRALSLLHRSGAKATFFVIGEKAAAHPDLLRAIRDAGHELGHHTHTHPVGTFWCAGPARVARELDATLTSLKAAHASPHRFRAPVGIKNPFLEPALAQRSLDCVGWSVRSWDSVRSDPAALVRHVMKRVKPGAIILLHEGPQLHSRIREHGLADLLTALAAAGYRCVIPKRDQLR